MGQSLVMQVGVTADEFLGDPCAVPIAPFGLGTRDYDIPESGVDRESE